MKKLMFSALMMATLFFACQSGGQSDKAKAPEQNSEATEHDHAHGHAHDATTEHHDMPATDIPAINASINDLISGYLKIKNALTSDNSEEAATVAKTLVVTIAAIDETAFTPAQKKTFDEVMDDTKEHAVHIGDNGGKLDHQREHFAMLSKDVNDLLKNFDAGQKLYQDYCPMYDDGKGAIWISEIKDIKNPYYGSKMLSCGKMQKEI